MCDMKLFKIYYKYVLCYAEVKKKRRDIGRAKTAPFKICSLVIVVLLFFPFIISVNEYLFFKFYQLLCVNRSSLSVSLAVNWWYSAPFGIAVKSANCHSVHVGRCIHSFEFNRPNNRNKTNRIANWSIKNCFPIIFAIYMRAQNLLAPIIIWNALKICGNLPCGLLHLFIWHIALVYVCVCTCVYNG